MSDTVEAAEQILKSYMDFGTKRGSTFFEDLSAATDEREPEMHRFDTVIGKYDLEVRVVFEKQEFGVHIDKVFTETGDQNGCNQMHDIRSIISDEVIHALMDKAEAYKGQQAAGTVK